MEYGGLVLYMFFFFFQAEDGIRDYKVTGVQTCALPIYLVASAAVARAVSAVMLEERLASAPCARELSDAIAVLSAASAAARVAASADSTDSAREISLFRLLVIVDSALSARFRSAVTC